MEYCTSKLNSLRLQYLYSFNTALSLIVSLLLAVAVAVVVVVVYLLCSDVECPILAAPEEGLVSMTTRSIVSLAEYSCGTGFRILGPEQRTCLQNGTWSGEDPVCERKKLHHQ